MPNFNNSFFFAQSNFNNSKSWLLGFWNVVIGSLASLTFPEIKVVSNYSETKINSLLNVWFIWGGGFDQKYKMSF